MKKMLFVLLIALSICGSVYAKAEGIAVKGPSDFKSTFPKGMSKTSVTFYNDGSQQTLLNAIKSGVEDRLESIVIPVEINVTIPNDINLKNYDSDANVQQRVQAAIEESLGDDVADAYFRVIYQNPQLFYAATSYRWNYRFGYYTNNNYVTVSQLSVDPVYIPSATPERCLLLEEQAKGVIAELITDDMNDITKALVLHDYVVDITTYNHAIVEDKNITGDEWSNFTAFGVFSNKLAVCQGYSLAYNYLLDLVGIDTYMVSSYPMSHAWSAVLVGGKWYHVDPTWDDAVITLNETETVNVFFHTYFLLSNSGFPDNTDPDIPYELDHYAWDLQAPICSDTSFDASNHVFKKNVWEPIKYCNGSFYYKNEFVGNSLYRKYYSCDYDGENKSEITESDYNAVNNDGRPFRIYPVNFVNDVRTALSTSTIGGTVAYVKAQSGTAAEQKLYAAAYGSDGKLLSVTCPELTLRSGYFIAAPLNSVPGTASVKLFFLDGESFRPASDGVLID